MTYAKLSYYKDQEWWVYSTSMPRDEAREVSKQFLKEEVSTIITEIPETARFDTLDWSYVNWQRRGGRGGPVEFP